MFTPFDTLLCNLPSFHKHYSNEKPFRASLRDAAERLLNSRPFNLVTEVSYDKLVVIPPFKNPSWYKLKDPHRLNEVIGNGRQLKTVNTSETISRCI